MSHTWRRNRKVRGIVTGGKRVIIDESRKSEIRMGGGHVGK